MIYVSILLSLLLILSQSQQTSFKICNFTDYRFQSKYNLGKQEQLNKTFDSIAPKLSLSNVTYPVNSYTNYTLTNIKTSLEYLDSKQKAQIMGNDTILIDGGYLLVTMDMNWSRKDFLQKGGSLTALCKSQQIMFTKNLSISQGFLLYQIQQYYNLTFDNQCKIIRHDPANISDLDMGYIMQLLNQRDDKNQTAKSVLKAQIDKRYLFQLNNSLYNQKHQLDDKFTYQWSDQTKGKKLSIQYQVLPTGVYLDKAGLSFTFITEIRDYQKWQCGAMIPSQYLDLKKYGGIQQFISLSLFKNTLKYGIQMGALDTVLNRVNWQSKMFQFYAGDLYQVMPYISQTYVAKQQIIGSCKGVSDNVAITPQQAINQLLIQTDHLCSLFIKGNTKILDIKISLYSSVTGKFEQQSKVNFYVKSFTHNLSYLEQPLFKIANYQLANAMLLSTLNRVINTKTYGSGWPIFKMDLPQFKVMPQGYIMFYDASHVGDIQLQQA